MARVRYLFSSKKHDIFHNSNSTFDSNSKSDRALNFTDINTSLVVKTLERFVYATN